MAQTDLPANTEVAALVLSLQDDALDAVLVDIVLEIDDQDIA